MQIGRASHQLRQLQHKTRHNTSKPKIQALFSIMTLDNNISESSTLSSNCMAARTRSVPLHNERRLHTTAT